MKEEKAHVQKPKQSTTEGCRTMLYHVCVNLNTTPANVYQIIVSYVLVEDTVGVSQSMGGVSGHKHTNMHVLYTDSTHIQRQTKYGKSGLVPILLPFVFAF